MYITAGDRCLSFIKNRKSIMDNQDQTLKFLQSTQKTQLNSQLPDFNALEVDGILFFCVDMGKDGKQLWKTDGTPQGTVFIRNLQF